jgi:hypothetical protein
MPFVLISSDLDALIRSSGAPLQWQREACAEEKIEHIGDDEKKQGLRYELWCLRLLRHIQHTQGIVLQDLMLKNYKRLYEPYILNAPTTNFLARHIQSVVHHKKTRMRKTYATAAILLSLHISQERRIVDCGRRVFDVQERHA